MKSPFGLKAIVHFRLKVGTRRTEAMQPMRSCILLEIRRHTFVSARTCRGTAKGFGEFLLLPFVAPKRIDGRSNSDANRVVHLCTRCRIAPELIPVTGQLKSPPLLLSDAMTPVAVRFRGGVSAANSKNKAGDVRLARLQATRVGGASPE